MKKKSIRILIADDHKLFRRALSNLIRTFGFPTTLYEASNGQEAIEIITKNPVDIVLLDIQMPVLSGIETMKRLKDLALRPTVIVLTQFDEQSLISYMLHLGASGFILKDCEPEELKSAIISVMKAGYFYNGIVLKMLQSNISNGKGLVSLEISSREFQVMVLLKEGKSNKEISKILNLSLRTIESYRKALMKKTSCRNVAEIVSLAYRTGIVAR